MKRLLRSIPVLLAGALPLAGQAPGGKALDPAQITIHPEFKVELVRNAQPGEGSWICMAVDGRGRLLVSPQDTNGLLRITLQPGGQVEKVERIPGVGMAMGLAWAHESLYLVGWGPESKRPQEVGLYRLRDTNGDDQLDEVRLLKTFEGGFGEHGSHAILPAPDGSLYIMHGNFVSVPKEISPQSPHRRYAEDLLLPRAEDGNGFGIGYKPPGGFLTRTDSEGREWTLVAGGFRNIYDIAMNPDGELFGFDSDMEWDLGLPWYRPTRIFHLVSGGEYGYREGSGKWPEYYPDLLPPAVNIGLGSPTGLKFGTEARFPEKYRRALFAMDWTYGRILAVHLQPFGSTYRGTFEPFLSGRPLPVTAMEVGRDGALYFVTGGRGQQSGLYRVTYQGKQPVTTSPGPDPLGSEARSLRRKLESYHGKGNDASAVDAIWPHLGSEDRFIRYAARVALETIPLAAWKDRALKEGQSRRVLSALLAWARVGPAESQGELLGKLSMLGAPPDSSREREQQTLDALRVLQLAFIRMGRPNETIARDTLEVLDPLYPAPSDWVNRELSQILIYLEAPGVAKKTMQLLLASHSQEDQIHYIFHLRNLAGGWTLEDRQLYFGWFAYDRRNLDHEPAPWFKQLGRPYADGASLAKYLAQIKNAAIQKLSAEERASLAPIITGQIVVAPPAPAPRPRPFVKDWKMEDLVPHLEEVAKGRSHRKGKEVWFAAQCAQCHRFGTTGGASGPDLTAVGNRFNRRDLLETLLLPSRVISDQYQNITVEKKDGTEVTGRLVEETAEKAVLVVDPLSQKKVEVPKAEIARRAPSPLSPMPEGLLNTFTREEILDLLAYLESGGDPESPLFHP